MLCYPCDRYIANLKTFIRYTVHIRRIHGLEGICPSSCCCFFFRHAYESLCLSAEFKDAFLTAQQKQYLTSLDALRGMYYIYNVD